MGVYPELKPTVLGTPNFKTPPCEYRMTASGPSAVIWLHIWRDSKEQLFTSVRELRKRPVDPLNLHSNHVFGFGWFWCPDWKWNTWTTQGELNISPLAAVQPYPADHHRASDPMSWVSAAHRMLALTTWNSWGAAIWTPNHLHISHGFFWPKNSRQKIYVNKLQPLFSPIEILDLAWTAETSWNRTSSAYSPSLLPQNTVVKSQWRILRPDTHVLMRVPAWLELLLETNPSSQGLPSERLFKEH